MKVPLSWLKYYIETDASVEAIAAKLNAVGLEVEAVEDRAGSLAGFRIARVLSAQRHPNADKLQVLSVDAGDGEPFQVVCGAPNARAGLVGVLGLPGAVVPADGFELKKSAIRGVESNGMMCSSRELELGDDHDGIIELPGDAPVGAAYADYAGRDPVFDVGVTPNRPDCLGIMGIARDLAAAGLGRFKPVAVPDLAGSFPCPVEVRTDDPQGCPAFYGRVIRGVRNGASPDWMQTRLRAAGQRPVSALVDCTNYLMLACGRPGHVYDLKKLTGAVVARRARGGETMTALNGKQFVLDPEITVIADDKGVHDIAGIMGGDYSGCSEETTDVLLEIAYFDPVRIGNSGRKLNLVSDARARFERGVDPAFLDDGLALLTDLILITCGGEASEIVRAGTPPHAPRRIRYEPTLCARLGGLDVPPSRQGEILESLGFSVIEEDSQWLVTAPSWRPDIDGEADLVEEIARIHGFDQIPATPLFRLPGVARPTATALQRTERRLRRAAAAAGLDEAISWSFIAAGQAAPFGAEQWLLANPISEEMKVMRPSLVPGLAAAARRNLDRGATSIRLFEIGRRYLKEGERPTLGLLLAGERARRSWHSGRAEPFTSFDAKAEVLALLEAAGAPVASLQLTAGAGDTWHPGRSALLTLGRTEVAAFGELHPRLIGELDAPAGSVAAEIYLDALPAPRSRGRGRPPFAPSPLQPVRRDFAFIVADEMLAGDLIRAIRSADKARIVEARLFDRFRTAADELSLAVEVALQPAEASFTEAEIAAISERIVAAAAKLGARLRS